MILKKNKTKKSIPINFLNHDSVYKTESIIHENITRVKITQKKKNNTKM
jgi:hypothetical protein